MSLTNPFRHFRVHINSYVYSKLVYLASRQLFLNRYTENSKRVQLVFVFFCCLYHLISKLLLLSVQLGNSLDQGAIFLITLATLNLRWLGSVPKGILLCKLRRSKGKFYDF